MSRFIDSQRAQYGIPHAVSCRALDVSQSWFYKWRHGDASPRHARRAQLVLEVKRLFAKHKGKYGSPRITADLHDEGWAVSANTVAKIMVEQHLASRPKRRRRGTTRQGKGRWRAPDLVKRDFGADRINQKWYGDGTEIKTDEGKMQLDSVLDMASRRIVGFSIGEHHDAELAYGALAMAVAVRGGKENITGVLLHTDQGSEFTAHTFRKACERCGITQSMGRPGSGLDNAVIESWHSTLEFELRTLEHFDTKAEARAALVEFIDDYNTNRKHSALGMRSPLQHEQTLREEHGTRRAA
jgi:transposase InsO family protein